MTTLTPQQREAVEHDGNLLLTACPGSGKTRVIMAKLLLLAEQFEDTPRSIGCITYTNAAVEEIESRINSCILPSIYLKALLLAHSRVAQWFQGSDTRNEPLRPRCQNG